MKVRNVTPLATARDFKLNEMFFSTTDARGVIESGNDVFVRVSGFSEGELLGQPHNIIRHPDMPRVAFQLLWEELKAGRAFAAYVKNMAHDGAFYWVVAVIVPLSRGRYLSIRFKPTSSTHAAVEKLYALLRQTEERALAGGATPKDAMTESRAVLERELGKLGFPSYERFSHAALNGEIDARDRRLSETRQTLFPASIEREGVAPELVQIYRDGQRVYGQITTLYGELHAFLRFHEQLQNAGRSVLGVSDDFRMHALNVNITAQHHGLDGRTVGVVATFLDNYAQELGRGTHEMREHIKRTSSAIEGINADIAMARLQMEMILAFQGELANGAAQNRQRLAMLTDLEEAFVARTRSASRAIAELQSESARLAESREHLSKVAVSIQMAQVRGLTEAARIPDAENLRTMFGEFRRKIDSTNAELGSLDDALSFLRQLTLNTPRMIAEVGGAAEDIHQRVCAFAPADAAPAQSAAVSNRDPKAPLVPDESDEPALDTATVQAADCVAASA